MDEGRPLWAVAKVGVSSATLLAWSIRAAGENIIWLAVVVGALGVLWRQVLRPSWKRSKAALTKIREVHDLLERELTPDHGGSMKDQQQHQTVLLDQLTSEVAEVRATGQATTQVLDGLVERFNHQIEEVWRALEDDEGTPK